MRFSFENSLKKKKTERIFYSLKWMKKNIPRKFWSCGRKLKVLKKIEILKSWIFEIKLKFREKIETLRVTLKFER